MGRSLARAFATSIVIAAEGALLFACSTDYGVRSSDGGGASADAPAHDVAVANDGGGAPQGTLGGQCYPNGTCNADLTCVFGMCIPTQFSGDASMNGKDGGNGPPSCAPIETVGNDCFASGGGPSDGIECIGASGMGGGYNAACGTESDGGCKDKRIGCLTANDCNGASGPICCFNVSTFGGSSMCGTSVVFFSSTVSACVQSCAGAAAAVGCRTQADCAGTGGTCKGVSANDPDASALALFGICTF
jgi:hypothetical protein